MKNQISKEYMNDEESAEEELEELEEFEGEEVDEKQFT